MSSRWRPIVEQLELVGQEGLHEHGGELRQLRCRSLPDGEDGSADIARTVARGLRTRSSSTSPSLELDVMIRVARASSGTWVADIRRASAGLRLNSVDGARQRIFGYVGSVKVVAIVFSGRLHPFVVIPSKVDRRFLSPSCWSCLRQMSRGAAAGQRPSSVETRDQNASCRKREHHVFRAQRLLRHSHQFDVTPDDSRPSPEATEKEHGIKGTWRVVAAHFLLQYR